MTRKTRLIGDRHPFFPGTTDLSARMRAFDWSRTPIGEPKTWPANLRVAVRLCLTSPVPMHICWGSERTIFCNDAQLALLKRCADSRLLGCSGPEVFPELWDTIGPVVDTVFAAGEPAESTPTPVLAGCAREETAATFAFSPIFGDEETVDGTFCVCSETTLTGNRQVDEKQEYTWLLEALEEAPVGIAVLRGPLHTFEFVNRSYATLVGHRAVLDRPIREAQPELERTENGSLLDVLDEVYQSGQAAVSPNLRVWLSRGTNNSVMDEHIFRVVCQPLRTNTDTVDGLVVIAAEVTELETARRQAESASRAKDEFLAMLGHELRNPLAPILTALHLMRLKGFTGGERERTLIERQVNHLVSLVDDLLDVSRITQGKIQLHKRRIHLADAVAKAIEMTSPLLEEGRHQLHIDVPRQRELEIDADLERFSQVVANLLTNAAKYTEAGGRIWVTAASEHDDVVLRVRDNGIGISPEMLPRVFDSFTQERQALDRARGGLGLGLSIVRSLVELHGGRITARSEGVRTGSEFEIRLPRAASSITSTARTDQPSGTASARSASGLRILVVDDNQDAAQLLAESLRHQGHQTQVALDAFSALRVAGEFKPDVALLDIGLPGMDGYELGGRLRQIPGLSRLRLMAVTGYGQDSDRQRSAAAGFESHLVKPVELAQLDQLVGAARHH